MARQPFVYSGLRKIRLTLGSQRAAFLFRPQPVRPRAAGLRTIREFFRKYGRAFAGRCVGVILPDATRAGYGPGLLAALARELKKTCRSCESLIALGLHRRMTREELETSLGKAWLRACPVRQHDPNDVVPLGRAAGVPLWLNRRLAGYDVLLTLGVVEPHLYAGFSGGVKGVSIGLAGRETILHTHAVKYLCRPGVQVGNLERNPFQAFLWAAAGRLQQPVYSFNLVHTPDHRLAGLFAGPARPAFKDAVRQARRLFTRRVPRPCDVLFVGCDHPKDRSLYQASRLFNYVLEKKRLVRRGGAIVVFASLSGRGPSAAERNFERALAQRGLPRAYGFKLPGEHRAFKVLQAAAYARLALVAPQRLAGRYPALEIFPGARAALAWAHTHYGPEMRLGVIPWGFSFLPA